jgi:hypothetical protein
MLNDETPQLIVDETAKNHLKDAAGWAKFLGIAGFVFLGLLILSGFVIGSALTQTPGVNNAFATIGGIGVTLIYIILAAIYFYPIYALYKFSVLCKEAVYSNDNNTFARAMYYLKSMFKYIGVITIIILALYLLIIILLIMVGSFAGMHR